MLYFIKSLPQNILLSLHGGLNFYEIVCYALIKGKICKSKDAIMIEITNDKIANYYPLEQKDINKLITFRLASKCEKRIASILLEAINARVAKDDYLPIIERMRVSLNRSVNVCSVPFLLDLETLAITGGLFVLAYEIRKACTEKLMMKYKRKEDIQYFDIKRLFSIYLCNGDNAKAIEVLERAGSNWRKFRKYDYEIMMALAKNDRLAEYSSMEILNTKQNAICKNLIKGKRVAIIGPTAGPLNPDLIDKEYDIKIRISYRGKAYLPEDQGKCRTDISYYNHTSLDLINEMTDINFLDELKMIVTKKNSHVYKKIYHRNSNIREIPLSFGCLAFQGIFHMVQNILFDILAFAPANVKIFNANLYMSNENERYHSGYQIKIPESRLKRNGSTQCIYSKNMWYIHAKHNLITNFEMIKLCHDKGYFECDKQLTKTLSLDINEYLQKMENLF